MIADPWLAARHLDPDGIWRSSDPGCEIGAVGLIRNGQHFVTVRKSYKPGYEFSSLDALPGGLLRNGSGLSVEKAALFSLRKRIAEECGLHSSVLSDLRRRADVDPTFSRYTVKGVERTCRVLMFTCNIASQPKMRAAHHSIERAFWTPIPPAWNALTPANCTMLLHALWTDLSPSDREDALHEAKTAIERCAAWAHEIGVRGPRRPWEA